MYGFPLPDYMNSWRMACSLDNRHSQKHTFQILKITLTHQTNFLPLCNQNKNNFFS
jgi:hypothetical protein